MRVNCQMMGHDRDSLPSSTRMPAVAVGRATGFFSDLGGNEGTDLFLVGLLAFCLATQAGLRFGVSEHLPSSFYWYGVAHECDETGPLAGVPYDGTNPEYADLYHDFSGMKPGFYKTAKAEGINKSLPERWKRHYYSRIKDLIDQHEPDLLYTDGSIPFEEYGLGLVAELYNAIARSHAGRLEAVYNSKLASDCETGTCTLDEERGIFDEITPFP